MNANDSRSSSETNWERIDQLTEEEIDTSDIPPLDDAFFTNALCVYQKERFLS